MLAVCENGYGKRTLADEYRLQGRGGSGVINVKTTERNGKVVGIAQVTEKSEVMLISQYGKIIRMDSTTIRESGRAAQGVRLLNLEPGDRVAAAVVLAPGEEPTNGATLLQYVGSNKGETTRASVSSLRHLRPAPVNRQSSTGDGRNRRPARKADMPAPGHSGYPRRA